MRVLMWLAPIILIATAMAVPHSFLLPSITASTAPTEASNMPNQISDIQLSTTAFKIETQGYDKVLEQPAGDVISLPVLPYGGQLSLTHAVSLNSYQIRGFRFTGTFMGAPVAPNAFDEEAVFAASDVSKFNGHEFGFRLSLKDNILYGYIQDGSNTVTQGKTFFKNVRLMTNDCKQHQFEVGVVSKGNSNSFTWLIDGKIYGTYLYAWTTSFLSLSYNLVATTHCKESGWYREGLFLALKGITVIQRSS